MCMLLESEASSTAAWALSRAGLPTGGIFPAAMPRTPGQAIRWVKSPCSGDTLCRRRENPPFDAGVQPPSAEAGSPKSPAANIRDVEAVVPVRNLGVQSQAGLPALPNATVFPNRRRPTT